MKAFPWKYWHSRRFEHFTAVADKVLQRLCLDNLLKETKILMTTTGYGDAYKSGFDRTVRFLMSRGAPRESALEAAQAAWVRGFERLSQLRNESMVVTWVNTIALNVYRSFLRKQNLTEGLGERQSVTKIDIAAIDVARVLKFCRANERVLLEQQMEGVTAEEIARVEGVTETAVRIRLLRARRAARGYMERRAGHLRRVHATAVAA